VRRVRKLVVLGSVLAALWLAPGAFAAGWCGSGESATDRPDIVTGQQIHAVVAVPSDGADNFTADAAALADDVASIDTWWQTQDPTRLPRFDQALFGASSCLDISFVRLSDPAASYSAVGAGGAFDRVISEIARNGHPYKDYLVYYDGPAVEADVCGTGGTRAFDTGLSFAVVWMQGCSGVPTATIAAHELLHALGAVPGGAPHACPGDLGHVCDHVDDLMYPTTSGQPLSSLYLDFNHDDYYGHSGSWPDIQDSLWLHRLDLPQEPLNLTFSGAGEITSDLPGLDCKAACTTQWDQGAAFVLIASPAPGDRFVRWGGACAGTGTCELTLNQPATAKAVFGPVRIPLRVTAAGRGTVACTPSCTKTFRGGDALTLRAVPAHGWRFASWSGGCAGTKPTCRPPTDFALSVRATFRRR
jgi:hypothetical protein